MILCVGTTPAVQRTMIFEKVWLDAVNRAAEVRVTAGGKSSNVVRVLRHLGEQALATGFVGGDTGRIVRQELERGGVRHDFVEVGPATRTCITMIDRADGTATELVEEAAEVEPEAWPRLEETFSRLLQQAKAAVLSGSLPPGASADFYARSVQAAADRGVPVVLDARGEPLRQALGRRPLVVKVNRAELAATLGVEIDSDPALRVAMQDLAAAGAQWVVVTLGSEGAMAYDGRSFSWISGPPVQALNPIGSGDAFAAGLAAGIVRGQYVPQACALGAACGAANAMSLLAGHVEAKEVERILSDVRIQEV